MPILIEAYTFSGVVTGRLTWPGHLRDALETSTELLVEGASHVPLDGRPTSRGGEHRLVVDDVVLAVPDEDMPGPVHAAWHAISLDAGPYRLKGELATMPGFDPGRALARPTGTFVLLRDVRLALLDRLDEGEIQHDQGLVNRYTVDAVDADLMLGFFFPGAKISVDPAGTMVTAAGTERPGMTATQPAIGAPASAVSTEAASTDAGEAGGGEAGGGPVPLDPEASAAAPTA